MLHQINDIYCVNLTEINNIIPQNKKINHIIAIDNQNTYDKKCLNEIINLYPNILSQYNKITLLKNIYLIATYPKLKCIQIDKNNMYTEFRKLTHSPQTLSLHNNTSQLDILNECLAKIDNECINEIVIFANVTLKPNQFEMNLLNMLNEHTLSIITANNIILDPIITYKLTSTIEYSDFINSKIFLHVQDNNTQKIINVKEANVIGINTNIIKSNYNFIPISTKIDSIVINDLEHQLIFQEIPLTTNDIFEMVECVLYNTDLNENIVILKNILFNILNPNVETKNKILAINHKYKNIYDNILSNTINNLNDNTNENIQMMLEYGKKTTLSHNKNFLIPKIDNINIDNFTKIHETNVTKQFNNSLELFESSITLSNWFDEVKNNCALGLLFNFESSDLTKKGVHGFGVISNISNTFMSITDFIGNANDYFSNNRGGFGDLNNVDVVKDSFVGEANAILPIYIHKQHWTIAKLYLKPLLGIIQAHSPFSYMKAHENIYFSVFVIMTQMLFSPKKEFLNNKFVQVYFSFFRTCAEICFENAYNFGIKNLMNTYMNNPLNRISKSYLDYDKLFAQTLTTGYNITNIEIFLQYLLEEKIRLCVKTQKYSNAYIESLTEMLNDSEKLNNEFDVVINHICNSINFDIKIFAAFYKINKIFRGMINLGSTYGQFIKHLDKNYGVLDDVLTEYVIKSIISTKDNITFEEFYNIINVTYNKNKIIIYILQGIAHINNKILQQNINNGNFIDVLNTDIDNDYVIKYLSC